jgi:transposase
MLHLNSGIAVIGIDIGKNSFHLVGHDQRGAIVLRQKWSRGQMEPRLANLPACLIGMEACVGAHHFSRRLKMLGHDARLMPAKYVRRPIQKDKRTTSATKRRDRRGGTAPHHEVRRNQDL